MNERDRATLVAMRAQIDAILGAPTGAVESPPPSIRAAEWMRIIQFAKTHRYSTKTISQWCRLGMPHIGRGHYTRINVRAAEKWIAEGGPTLAARIAGMRAHARTMQ